MQAPSTAANSAFHLKFEELLARAPAGVLRRREFVHVPSNQKPWLDTGKDVAESSDEPLPCGLTFRS